MDERAQSRPEAFDGAEAIDALARQLRPEFPLLERSMAGWPLVYLDSASTTPKPRAVIDAVVDCYERRTANVHRGSHGLADEATRAYDDARVEVASFIGASPDEIVFVRGATEAHNLLAHALGLAPDDEVVFPASEHHANWLPWRARATPVLVPGDADGVPRWEALPGLLTPRSRLVAFAHASNVTGVIAPVTDLVAAARARGVPVLVDAAQSLSHLPIDVRALGVDFLSASAHKAFGPSGVGFLYARRERMRDLGLYQVGGGMVASNEEGDGGPGRFVARPPPFCFEAGTPAIEGAIGFGAALRWLRGIGMAAVRDHDVRIGRYLVEALRAIPGVRVLAEGVPAAQRTGLATFVLEARAGRTAISAENAARSLSDLFGVAVSGGLHCAHVLHARAHLDGTLRASPHVFNTRADVDRLAVAVRALGGG